MSLVLNGDIMPKVLIIDDDEAVRDAFQLALEPVDVEVVVAEDGLTGLEIALSQTLDLIFLDLKMPGIDGVETLRRLRAAGIETTVYIVTAFLPEFLDQLSEATREGLRFGLGQKPLSRSQIQSIAKSMLTKKS